MSTSKNATVSSSFLRERDKKILETHEKERAELEWKLQKMKRITDETAKELFDAVHRGNRLARSLGFEDIYAAQVFIDSAEYDISFKDCMGQLKVLQAELNCERKEAAVLQARLSKAKDSERLRGELDKTQAELHDFKRQQNEEIKVLQERYDALKAVKERAAERYKADYKKWRDFSKWIFAENDQHRKNRNERGISKAEKKRRDLASIMRKRQKMVEVGPNLARFEEEPDDTENYATVCNPPPIGGTEPNEDKENGQLSSPSGKIKGGIECHATSNSPLEPLRDVQPSITNLSPPPSSPDVFLTSKDSRNPPCYLLPEGTPHKQRLTTDKVRPHMPYSSDTEDDSQAVFVPSTNPRSGTTAVFKVPAPPSTSGGHQGETPECVRRQLDFISTDPQRSDHRPSKVRRISGDEFLGPLFTTSPWCQDESTPSASKMRKRTEQTSSHDNDNLQRTDDYSVFKGRGRYGGQNRATDQTINGLYMIDPAKNGGKGYQYDDVVRSKEGRKKMHATDCECCWEYYENVGPLPKRLQQPLWRSPSTTPSRSHRPQSDPGQNKSESTSHRDDVDAHRQAVSRHRHTWGRAKTPPGYWEIGFPTTQEVGDINDKAKEMQRRKMAVIESEAAKDTGRYRRK